MRIKDIEVGQEVWYSTDAEELRSGRGTKVRVAAIGRYTQVRQPCGPVIVPTESPGPTKVILQFKEEDRRRLARFNSKTDHARFKMNDGGRYLVHEAEHRVARQAAEALAFERRAHEERGKELGRAATRLMEKELADLGVPVEHISIGTWRRYVDGGRRSIIKLDVKDTLTELVDTRAVRAALDAYDEHLDQPVPGKDCVV